MGNRQPDGQSGPGDRDPGEFGQIREAFLAGALDPDRSFVAFRNQDSGCLAYGIEYAGHRWFVKGQGPVGPAAAASLARAAALHAVVRHPVIVPLLAVLDGTDGPVLVYPWRDGEVLRGTTAEVDDSDPMARFRGLPLLEVLDAVADLLDAYRSVAAAGWIAGDLYDGCFLYDFARGRMQLIDLDECRPGPFVLESERLFGSDRYMAPEEFVRGSVIDERTTVFNLGRMLQQLVVDPDGGWRGTGAQAAVADRACADDPAERHPGVAALRTAWTAGSHT